MAWEKVTPTVVNFVDSDSGFTLVLTNNGGVGADGPISINLKNELGQSVGQILAPDWDFVTDLFEGVAAAL